MTVAPLSDGRRRQLLDELAEMLLAEGFVGRPVDEFATRLRCSKATLYRLAPSREQLVMVVGRHFMAQATGRIDVAIEAVDGAPARISAYLTHVGKEMMRGSPAFHRQMASRPPMSELYFEQSRAVAHRLGMLIEDGVKEGTFEPHYAEVASVIVAIVIEGIHQGRLLETQHVQADDAYRAIAELILHGLVKRDDRRPDSLEAKSVADGLSTP